MTTDPKKLANKIVLTEDQEKAWNKIRAWLATKSSVFVLKGFAGTGKSMMMRKLLELNQDFEFTAPTNKAAKVLASFLGTPTKTVYALLGLRMEARDDKMVLVQSGFPVVSSRAPILVVDEASMVPKQLVELIRSLCASDGWRVIYVGDPAQLNPVGESRSPAWSEAAKVNQVLLTQIVRYSNELLDLSVALRACIRNKEFGRSPVRDSNSKGHGVFVRSRYDFIQRIKSLPREKWAETKVVAWRNRTVDEYNRVIRKALGYTQPYEVGELIMLAAPMAVDGSIVAHTDDEFVISQIQRQMVTLVTGDELVTWRINVEEGLTLRVAQDEAKLQAILSKLAALASNTRTGRKQAWNLFWDVKNEFHQIRYSYALTAHRVQGTTLRNVFVDQQDILSNYNKLEAFKCLYVACTRAQKCLVTF